MHGDNLHHMLKDLLLIHTKNIPQVRRQVRDKEKGIMTNLTTDVIRDFTETGNATHHA
jgi:hypothetical protein